MILGVISDTHDHLENVKKALDIFEKRRVSLIVHCGDIISPFCLDLFNLCKIPYLAVFGNNDGEIEILLKRAKDRLTKEPRIEEIYGKKVLIKHFHHFVDELALTGGFDLILCGHTHKVDIRKINNTLIVNPGEACGWITQKATVALVDLSSMEAEVIELG